MNITEFPSAASDEPIPGDPEGRTWKDLDYHYQKSGSSLRKELVKKYGDQIELNKSMFIQMANDGFPKPSKNSEYGRRLRYYLTNDNCFSKAIKVLRPDWCKRSAPSRPLRVKGVISAAKRSESVAEIARLLGASRSGVADFIKRLGIKFKSAYEQKIQDEVRKETMMALNRARGNIQLAAKIFGISASAMYSRVHILELESLTINAREITDSRRKTATDKCTLDAISRHNGDSAKAAEDLGISLVALYGRVRNAKKRNRSAVREAFALKKVEYKYGVSIDEFAEKTGVPRSTAYRRLRDRTS